MINFFFCWHDLHLNYNFISTTFRSSNLDTSIYLIFNLKSASYNFLWRFIPSLTSPPIKTIKTFFTVSFPPRPAEERSCTIPYLSKKLWIVHSMYLPIRKPPAHGIMVRKRSSPLFFNVNITLGIFVYISWSASVKMRFLSNSFMKPCVLLIYTVITLVPVGGVREVSTQQGFDLNSGSETSS